ncbi:hypothetical protein E2C01_078603 [Portunus trituberculatus]|uniref:Uncharacterized protein n=1 Tax=Portunus trituberculatus TaxID=210409 RepID=A0A5B7IJ93_PORTR|nr:hypothetical protein [Portunus trituberculatus]
MQLKYILSSFLCEFLIACNPSPFLYSLKTQITNLGGTVGGGGEGGGALTETERRSVQDRLAKVQSELDSKRVTVKNLKLSLEKIDITE